MLSRRVRHSHALQDGGGLNTEAHKAIVKAAGNEARTARLKEEQVRLPSVWNEARQGRGYRSSLIALMERSCRGRNSKTILPFAMGCAQGAFLNAAMDATNPLRWSTGSAVRRAALWDSGMMTYAKNWHTCARWP